MIKKKEGISDDGRFGDSQTFEIAPLLVVCLHVQMYIALSVREKTSHAVLQLYIVLGYTVKMQDNTRDIQEALMLSQTAPLITKRELSTII